MKSCRCTVSDCMIQFESRGYGVVEGCDDPVDEVLFDLTLRIREGGGGGGGGHGGFLLVGLGERV